MKLQDARDRKSEDKDIGRHIERGLEYRERVHISTQARVERSFADATCEKSGLNTEVCNVEEGEKGDGEVGGES